MSQDRVLLTPVDPAWPRGVWAELDGDDSLTGGVGGWQTIDRPRRAPALEWVGTPVLGLALPLLLDGTADGRQRSVEAECARLIDWGTKNRRTHQPTVLKVTGPVRCTPNQRWVIQDLEWGAQIRDDRGRRIQQQVTVTMEQYAEAAIYRSPARKARDRNKGRGRGGRDRGRRR